MKFDHIKVGTKVEFIATVWSKKIIGRIRCKRNSCPKNGGPIICIQRDDGKLGVGCDGYWLLLIKNLNRIEQGGNYTNLRILGITNPNSGIILAE